MSRRATTPSRPGARKESPPPNRLTWQPGRWKPSLRFKSSCKRAAWRASPSPSPGEMTLPRPRTKTVDLAWLESNFPCMQACPVHTQAGRYVALIADGNYEEAYRYAREPNPLASICGRVCGHPCETACRRGKFDAPISIRALKRFLTERYGPESRNPVNVFPDKPSVSRPEQVAIIGSGPAGLAAAHDLALLGYSVTIFDAAPIPGGMLCLGIPE